jgi:hypothetical protein
VVISFASAKGGDMSKERHKVQFEAHRTVTEKAPVRFKTRDGEQVAFDARKKVKEPVRVKFMARDK